MRSLLVTLLVVLGATMVPTPALAATKPVVQSVSPASGTTDGGTTVTLKGDHFSHVRKVLFGSAAGSSVHVHSTGKLTVRTPKHGAGTVNIRVETTAGESAETSKDQYTYKLILTPHEAPRPAHANANPDVSLLSVDCAAAGSCVAVGNYIDSAGFRQGLVERLAGGRWEALKAPLPAKANSDPTATLNSVACATSQHCVAVGSYVDKDSHQDGFIETLANGKWTAKKAPLPTGVASGSTAELDAVACHSSGSCAASGTFIDHNSQAQGLLEALASGTWAATLAPLPNDASQNQAVQLVAIACPAAGSCTAVGYYTNPEQVGLVETLSHGNWHGHSADLPADASNGFQDVSQVSVSCASATACTAVGQYRDKHQNSQGLVERLPVGATSGSKSAVPSNGNSTPDVDLSGVSCVASGCTAVGAYRDDQSATAGLIEPLTGSGGPKQAPLPAGAGTTFAALEAISCPAARSCTAIGLYTDSHGDSQGVLDIESGAGWHAAKAPVPGNASATPFPTLSQVSCPSATSCVAIGQYVAGSSDATEGLIEQE